MYLVFTRMPGESYRRRLKSVLLDLCYVFRALNNSLVCSTCIIKCNPVHYVSLSLSLSLEGWMKKRIVLIPLPLLIKNSFVRSLSLSLSLSLILSASTYCVAVCVCDRRPCN